MIGYLVENLPELCFAKPGDRPDVQYKVHKAKHSNQDSRAEIVLPVRDNDVEDVDLEADESGLERCIGETSSLHARQGKPT